MPLNDSIPKLDELIGHRPLGRPLTLDGLEAEFRLIRQAQLDKPSTVRDFEYVGGCSGTHLLKLVSSRVVSGQHVLRFELDLDPRASHFLPSTDVKQIKAAKIAFRPLEVEGGEPKSLVDHVLHPDNRSSAVLEAFSNVYGDDALAALESSLTAALRPIEELPAREFPMIFLPHPNGEDVQATPVSPAVAYDAMRRIRDGYFDRRRDDSSVRLPDAWYRQHVSGKAQNISSAIGRSRTRFAARMPHVFGTRDAALYRYAHGGPFPYWSDEAVPVAIEKYAGLLDRRGEYSNRNIREGLDRRAAALVLAAAQFVEETMVEARELCPDVELPAPPKTANVLLRQRWRSDEERDRARRALTSDHFKSLARQVPVD